MKFAEIDLFGVYVAPLSVRPPSRRARAFSRSPRRTYAVFLTGRA